MSDEVIKVKATDEIKKMGLAPELRLHATLLCNNLRLSGTAEELAVEIAQANGVVAGLNIAKAISDQQREQLEALFGEIVQVTRAQHAVHIEDQLPTTVEPDFALENQAFERAAAKMGFQLDKRPSGVYVSQLTQRPWALWIHRAAIACAEDLAARRTQKIDGLDRYIQEQLADTIRDLARQDCPEFRGQYYGECRGMLKVLRLGEMLDEEQRDQWSADIYRASLQAADQCAASGQAVDDADVSKQRYQLENLAKRGITPRAELPR